MISSSFPKALITTMAAIVVGVLPGQAGDPGGASRSREAPAYAEAVRQGRSAAEAVLARGGAVSCLRGKLNRALLGLSSSCAAHAERTPLCDLAEKAVVVTPMTLAFMDDTARRMLQLSE